MDFSGSTKNTKDTKNLRDLRRLLSDPLRTLRTRRNLPIKSSWPFVTFVDHLSDPLREGLRKMADLFLKDEVYAIIGAAIEVHRELGSGFLEPVYQEAFEIELNERGIPFEAQKPLKIYYKDKLLTKTYLADLVCYKQIIVELKALNRLSKNEEAQILNYLKASNLKIGLLINFGSQDKLEWKRLVK